MIAIGLGGVLLGGRHGVPRLGEQADRALSRGHQGLRFARIAQEFALALQVGPGAGQLAGKSETVLQLFRAQGRLPGFPLDRLNPLAGAEKTVLAANAESEGYLGFVGAFSFAFPAAGFLLFFGAAFWAPAFIAAGLAVAGSGVPLPPPGFGFPLLSVSKV